MKRTMPFKFFIEQHELPCGKCFEQNCSCTKKELEHHEASTLGKSNFQWSITDPPVSIGDIVIKNGTKWYVNDIFKGFGVITHLSNDPIDNGNRRRLQEPYEKLVSVKNYNFKYFK